MRRKYLAIFLSFAMILTMLPFGASAEDFKERNRGLSYTHQYDEAIYNALLYGAIEDSTDVWRNPIKIVNLSDSKYGSSNSAFGYIGKYVRFANPEIVGVEEILQKSLNGYVTSSYAQMYDTDRSLLKAFNERVSEVMNEVYARIPEGASDFEKVHIVHDYLIACTSYSQDNLVNNILDDWTDHDASGVFIKHRGMCQGYSLAFKYIMDELGIECGFVESGTARHAWNVVKIGNEWYHVDLTGDDKGYGVLGRVEHTYLCLSTQSLLALDKDRADFIVYLDENTSFKDNTSAVSSTYENSSTAKELGECLDSYSSCVYYNNAVYTVNGDNNIEKYDRSSGKWSEFAQIPIMESVWRPNNIEGWNYTNLTPRFAVLAYAGGNIAYINSRSHVYEVNLDNGNMKEIFDLATVNSDSRYSIYGIAVVEDELMCEITNEAAGSAVELTKIKDVVIPKADKPKTVDMTLVDPKTGAEGNSISVSGTAGSSIQVSVKNPSSTVSVSSGNNSVATASYAGSKITVNFAGAGNTVITVGGSLKINVSVTKAYSETKTVELIEGETKTLTFNDVNIKSTVDSSMTDSSIAKVTAEDVNKQGTLGTAATLTKLSSYKAGTYVIGYQSGSTKKYLVNSGGSLTTTDDANKASKWTLSGSSSTCYLENSGSYLNHSTSGISLTSSKVSWKFSSGRLSFSQKSGSRFSSSKTYYLVYSNGFKVSTSTSGSASLYSLKEGTPEVAGEKYTAVTVKAVGRGDTTFEIGSVLYKVSVNKAPGTVVLKVNIKDDAGVVIGNSYEISGLEGTSYTVNPSTIYGYRTPSSVTGTYSENNTSDINLVYVLDTDKAALKSAVDGKVAKGNYTDASYSTYESKVAAGKTVLDKTRATQSEVDSVLSAINQAKAALVIKQKTITVKIVDDVNATLKDSYQITGNYGTSYTVTPETITGYITPSVVAGIYGENSADITLKYILNTDKSLLQVAVDGKVAQGNYTDETYEAYLEKVNAGSIVLNNARATQSEVDNALKAITDARNALAEKSNGLALDSNGIDSGSSYIIVSNGYALSGLSALRVTVNGVSIADPKNTNAVWQITKTNSGYTIYNKATSKYLGYKVSGTGSKRTCAPMLSSSKKYWKASTSGTGIQLYATSTYSYYLTCSNGSFTTTRTATTVSIYKAN